MGVIIKNIFNKERNLTKKDIERCIITIALKESSIVEYKSTHNLFIDKNGQLLDKKSRTDKKEEVILKPLIAFLNKFTEEGGVLILGISEENHIPKKIAPGDSTIFTAERLRNWFNSHIASIPYTNNFPEIEINNINVDGKVVNLIEVHPKDINVVYFSRLTNQVYIRRNDESLPLPLDETLRLVEYRKIPKIFIELEIINKEEINKIGVRYEFRLSYLNEGNSPGENTISILKFRMIKGISTDLKILHTPDLVPNDSIDDDSYRFQIDAWSKEIIYPKKVLNFTIGKLLVEINKDALVEMYIRTLEYHGFTEQIFVISPEKVNEEKREFKSYINL